MGNNEVYVFSLWWWLYLTKKERKQRIGEHLKDEKVTT